MAIVNTIATRVEAFTEGFRRGMDAVSKTSQKAERSVGGAARQLELFGKKQTDLELKSRRAAGGFASLDAAVARIGKGIKAADTPLAKFIQQNRTLGDVARNAIKFLAGMNPVLAVGIAVLGASAFAVSKLVREVVSLGESMLVMSQRTGLTVEELSGLRVAAELSNTSLEDVQGSIRFLNRLVAEAAGGSEEAAGKFKKLGVEFEDSEGKIRPLSALIADIGDRLARSETAATRAGEAQLVYGRSAARAIPLLGQSAEAQARLTAEARAFGGFISEDFARQADRFSDNSARMGFILEGLKLQIGGPIIRVLNFLGEALLRVVLVGKVFGEGINQVRGNLELLTLRLLRNEEGVKKAEKALADSHARVKDLAGAWNNLGEAIEKGTDALDDGAEALEDMAEQAAAAKAKLDPLEARFQQVFESLSQQPEKAGAGIATLGEELAKLGGSKAISGLNALINQASEVTGVGLENTIRRLRELRAEVQRGIDLRRIERPALEGPRRPEAVSTFAAPIAATLPPGVTGPPRPAGPQPVFPPLEKTGVPEVEDGLLRVDTVLGEIVATSEEEVETIGRLQDFAGGFGDALVDAALGAKGAFGDFFKGLAIQIAKAIAQATILAGLLSLFGIGGGFGKVFRGFLGFDDPGADAFAMAEGRRFGSLFSRGAGLAFAGATLPVASESASEERQVVVRPQIQVHEPGPFTKIEVTDRWVIPRLRQRLRTMGEEPFTR